MRIGGERLSIWTRYAGVTLVISVCASLISSLGTERAWSQANSTTQPSTGFVIPPERDTQALKDDVDRAAKLALDALQTQGGHAAERAKALAKLPSAVALDQLAVLPSVGPSTTAVPKVAPSGLAAAVNFVGIGGGPIAAHPGLALLLAQLEGTDDYKVWCSGTLVRPNVILTAAHCICDPGEGYTTAGICRTHPNNIGGTGSVLLDSERWRVFFQHVGVRHVTQVFPSDDFAFDETGVRSDLALLVLDKPVTWISTAQLPNSSTTEPVQGTAGGFGWSAAPGAVPATTMQALVSPGLKSQGSLQIVSCSGPGGVNLPYLTNDEAFCSQFNPGGAGSQAAICPGDSGGALWFGDQLAIEIGVTSGLNNASADCTASKNVGFQMRTKYDPHAKWIEASLAKLNADPPLANARWPAFGDNLRYILDRRHVQAFGANGAYTATGWAKAPTPGVILATLNTPGTVYSLAVQDRTTNKTLCSSQAGRTRNMPNVDYCFVQVVAGQEFRITSQGDPNQRLQFVISIFPIGTTFDE